MNETEEPTLSAEDKAAEAEIAARLDAFDGHKKQLLGMLCKAIRSPETFDANKAWGRLRFTAYIYLQGEAQASRAQARVPDSDRIRILRRLGKALGNARREAEAAMRTVRGHLFVEWCIANGNPDHTDPIIERYSDGFDREIAIIGHLEALTLRAAEAFRKKRGRPSGASVLPHDFIIALESMYRATCKRNAGAGPGPFARFVKTFLSALGRECSELSVIDAIKDARKSEKKRGLTGRWGRSFIDAAGGTIPPSSQ